MKIAFVCALVMPIFAGISDAADFEWKWSRDLPKEVATGAPPKNRTTDKIDALFRGNSPPTIGRILSTLGQPDGYSNQLYKPGGSLRWLLADGGALRVDTDFLQVYWAERFDKRGRATLLCK
jgi:hypothetical protein